jgi:hypothetical protein
MDHELTALRRTMIGTPAIAASSGEPLDVWGPTCSKFLDAVRTHTSRASSTYYFKTHLQYFASIYNSLAELRRILTPTAPCVLVVQDSFYKDIHNDLPRIFVEMADSIGWSLRHRWDFPIDRTMAAVNHRHHKYRTDVSAVESVLWFSLQ